MIKIHLSRLLGELRINQAELSKKTEIRAATINEMYHELIERVNLDYLSRICEALDCEVSDILEYIPDDEAERARKANRNKENNNKI
ncbi:MAG: helix-turn-helix transcriptional regulator [Defluviitaleaceae bacterium]|nr:helix-turn-helix transcriptional regulator [Defluviitaleaceae bacterium]